jgi:hypothetical protein
MVVVVYSEELRLMRGDDVGGAEQSTTRSISTYYEICTPVNNESNAVFTVIYITP